MFKPIPEMQYIAIYTTDTDQLPTSEEIVRACQTSTHLANRYLRQYQVFCYIDEFIQENGYSPSFRDIGQTFSLSTSVVSSLILGLVINGYVLDTPGIARSLRIVKYPLQSFYEVAG